MTNEQREAIDRLNKDKNKPLACGDITIVNVEDIETVLSMLKEKDAAIKKKNKIIDLMAEYIANRDNDEDICKYQVAEWCEDEEDGVLIEVCRKCIKQYFERKSEK